LLICPGGEKQGKGERRRLRRRNPITTVYLW
jgi:hypothetical protein